MRSIPSSVPAVAARGQATPLAGRAEALGGLVRAGVAGFLGIGLLAGPVEAAVYQVDVTGTFSLGPTPLPAFSGSFILDTSAAPLQHFGIPQTSPLGDFPLTIYQPAALSAVAFNVGATTFTGADLTEPSLGFGVPAGALYSGSDLAPGVATDIIMDFQQGSQELSVGVLLCLTLSSFSCELLNDTSVFQSSTLVYRSFDTAVTVTALGTPMPEPPVLPILALGMLALGVVRWQRR